MKKKVATIRPFFQDPLLPDIQRFSGEDDAGIGGEMTLAVSSSNRFIAGLFLTYTHFITVKKPQYALKSGFDGINREYL